MAAQNPAQLSNERLSLVYQLSRAFNSTLDLDEVLNMVMDEVIAALNAERGFVVLREEDNSLSFKAARGIDQTTLEDPNSKISHSVVEKVMVEGNTILTSDAQTDERFSRRSSVINLRLRSVLCAPLKVKGNLIGAIYLDNHLQKGLFLKEDLNLLNAIASSAAIAIDNARLYTVAVEKGRMERELQVARRVQASLMPQTLPSVPSWEFATRWIPAREVAGDFYDIFRTSDEQLCLIIADVADKGMPSALFMANSRSILRASMQRAISPKEGIKAANHLIFGDSADGMFLTLFYAQIDPATSELTYVNAGHNPPLLYRSDEEDLIELKRTGMAMGVFEHAPYDQRTISLNAGAFILFYTDGVTEAVNLHGQEFGEERLRKLLLAYKQSSAEDILAGIERSLRAFTSSVEPFDDITMMAVKRV